MKPSSRTEKQIAYLLLATTLLLSFVATLIFSPRAFIAAAAPLAEEPDDGWALLDSEPEAGQVAFAGVITALPDGTTTGEWTVGGQTVTVTADTRIHTHGNATLVPGNWAIVQATKNPDGTVTARQIHVVPPTVLLEGPVNGIPEGGIGPWLIAGQTIIVTEETRLGERAGPAIIGARVAVFAQQDENGDLVAMQIIVVDNNGDRIKLHGAIQEVGDTWLVSGIQLTVDVNTVIEGPQQVGLLANISATLPEATGLTALSLTADTPLLARHIRTDWRERQNDGPQRVALRGIIASLPASGLLGDWVVAANESEHTIHVGPNTHIVQTKGAVEVGAAVVVNGLSQSDGSINATHIVVLPNAQKVIRFEGTVESLPTEGLIGDWVISGRTVTVTPQTRIDEDDTPAAVGAQVQVIAWVRDDGSLVALKIEVEDDDDNPPGHFVRFVGPITQLPDTANFVGLWMVGVQQVQVTEDTEIEAEKAPVQLGTWVEVRGYQTVGLTTTDAGLVIAREIKTLQREQPGEPHPTRTPTPTPDPAATPTPTATPDDDDDHNEVEFTGIIEARPQERNGLWQIAGRQVMVNEQTRLDEREGPAIVGAVVEVEGWEMPGNSHIIAKKIKVED